MRCGSRCYILIGAASTPYALAPELELTMRALRALLRQREGLGARP